MEKERKNEEVGEAACQTSNDVVCPVCGEKMVQRVAAKSTFFKRIISCIYDCPKCRKSLFVKPNKK